MKHAAVTLALLVAAVPVLATARPIAIHRNAIVKVTMDDTISLADNHEGDEFSATVTDDRDLPPGTKFLGRVGRIHSADGDQPGYAELSFRRLLLPNGTETEVYAVPVKWNMARRDRDGRFRVTEPKQHNENYVLGGLLGGGLLGSLFHKTFEGAFVGTLAGIVAAESSNEDARHQYLIHRGETYGALLKEDFVLGDGAPVRTFDSQPRMDDRGSDSRNLGPIQIALEDRPINFSGDQQPYRNADTVMVPLDAASKEFKVDVDHANSGNVIYLQADSNSARLEVDNRDYRLNGKNASFNVPVEKKNGVLYVPIDVFAKLKVGRVTINGTDIR